MAGTSTIYDIKVRYAIDGDKASGGLKEIARHADKASEGVFSLKHAMEALAIREVFHLGKEALVDFNSEIEQAKIGLSTIMQMNLGMGFAKANIEADKLFNTFQQLAKKSPATTKDFMDMAGMIAPAVALAGGGPDKLAKLTAGAITAGLATGNRSDIVGMDVTEMLMGNVTKRNRLGNQMLGSIGMSHEEFNKKSQGDRASLVEKMFDQPALKRAADQMGETFKGQTSTLKDNLQIALGQVGLPLMKALTEEVKRWNEWIEKHPKLIAETVSEIGGMIKDAFGFVQQVAGWLYENKELFLTLGKTFLVFKGASLGANVFKKFADSVGNLVDSVKTSGTSIMEIFSGGGGLLGSIKMFAGAIGGAIPAIGLFIGALQVAYELLNTHSAEDKKAHEAQMSLHEALGDIPDLYKRRKELLPQLAGLQEGETGSVNQSQAKEELGRIEAKLFDPQILGESIKKAGETVKGLNIRKLDLEDYRHFKDFMPNLYDFKKDAANQKTADELFTLNNLLHDIKTEDLEAALKYANPDRFGKPDLAPPKPEEPWRNMGPDKSQINVTIQKIEVASEDPDRFVFGLAKIGEQATKHPTQSQHTVPGGF
jgi:hypothetical protein